MKDNHVELPLLKGKPKEKYIPMSVIVGIIVFLLLILIGSLAFTFRGSKKIHYSEKSNIDYRVYLKDNDYYQEKYLGKGKKYIASLIKNIDATFDYQFKIDEKIGINYTYYIVAKLDVNDTSGTNIYSKEEKITNKKTIDDFDGDTFKIHENAVVDYVKYSQLANDFIEKYKLSSSAKLTVSLVVDVTGKHVDFEKGISNKEVISYSVPLTEKTVDVSLDYQLANSTDEVLQTKAVILNNKILLFFVIFLCIIDVAAIIYIIYWVVVNRDITTIYNRKLDKILRDYNRYISETIITERVEDMMVTRSLRIEVVKSFNDLLDIRDALNKPILYHEERPNEEAVFYILTERIGYLYVMKAEDLMKEKKSHKGTAEEEVKRERRHSSRK